MKIRISFIKENIDDFIVEKIDESFDARSPEFTKKVFEWIKDVYRYDYGISRDASDKLEAELATKSKVSYDELNQLFDSLDDEFGSSQDGEFYIKSGFTIKGK